MATLSLTHTHARRPLVPAAEAALWAVWFTARWTGLGLLIGWLRTRTQHARVQLDMPHWVERLAAWPPGALAGARAALHRLVLRARLEAAHVATDRELARRFLFAWTVSTFAAAVVYLLA